MRRNLKDHFEAMYLRYNMAEQYMRKADQTILQDTQFKKVVAYMAGTYFHRYKDLLMNNGFEFDDLHNIITVFGLTYWGHSKPEARDKKAFMFMMRYIGQRMQTLIRWISRKFGADEATMITSDSFQFLADRSMYSIYSDVAKEDEDEITPEDVQDEIDSLSLNLTVRDRYTSRAIRERKAILSKIRKESTARKKMDAELTSRLRAKLMSDPSKHKDQLCYYATSKHIGKDMRNKARSLCKKCGIDYIGWLKEKSIGIDFDTNQFTF